MKILIGVFIVAVSLGQNAQGQVTITVLERDHRPLDSTADIKAFRFASFEEEDEVRVGETYQIGDELMGLGTTNLEVRCRSTGVLAKFSGRFRVLILPAAADEACAFNLLAGNADVLGDEPTRIDSGEITLGSKSTVYGLHLTRNAEGWSVDCPVYDGEVVVRYPGVDQIEIGAGRTMTYRRATGARWRPLGREDVLNAARLYAGMDLSKAKMEGVRPADEGRSFEFLSALYGRIFVSPERIEPRLQLAAEQADLRLTTDAVYHLNQAERLHVRSRRREIPSRPPQPPTLPDEERPARPSRPVTPPDEESRRSARIALLRAVVHVQLGDSQEAVSQLDRARSLDPAILNREDLKTYGIDESMIRRIRPDVDIAPSRVPR